MGNILKLSESKAGGGARLALYGNHKDFFSAVIFDMDGLVLDTESTYSLAWQKASAEMGHEFTEDFCLSMSGLHYQAIEQKLINFCGADFDLKAFNRLSGVYWRRHVNEQGISIKKGFFNLLDKIDNAGMPFCLATNSRKVNALECLKLAGLEGVFSIVVSRDDVSKAKPSPDIFLTAANYLNTPINRCLALEDSLTGVKAAVLAGTQSIFIPSVFPADQAAVDLAACFFNNLDELAQIIYSI